MVPSPATPLRRPVREQRLDPRPLRISQRHTRTNAGRRSRPLCRGRTRLGQTSPGLLGRSRLLRSQAAQSLKRTIAYDQQATEDAQAADRAAGRAESYATDARASADEAALDAEAARAAASEAEQAAKEARDAADHAAVEAAAAEQAAKDAQAYAESAQQA
ncbi:hypothetical protein, partial [Streptomyces fumanus]|uniref:hypothetical protein n=1 Tax=Streptomyces fumanus TaxID=67302 RepID=UPI0033333FEB